jgi:hypothetical protein
MNAVPEFDQGDVRSARLWRQWLGSRSKAHQTREPDDITKARDVWDEWLISYLPDPADRLPIPRPVIP